MPSLSRRGVKRTLVTGAVGLLIILSPLVYAGITNNDNHTNGFETQASYDADLAVFQAREEIADGLGPIYNAQSCAECHANTINPGSSQINELRAGKFDGTAFTEHAGGSLINDRALDPVIQEHVANQDNVRTFRTSLNLLGDGFVEAIPDAEFSRILAAQPTGMKGTIINVPVLEAPGQTRIARFGWKNQHASLLSFSADAYRNEMGITNPLFPTEQTSENHSVAAFDTVSDPEDAATSIHPFGPDVEAFTRLIRSTKMPVQDPDLAAETSVQEGERLFKQIGCDNCHTTDITTAPEGTSFNGGTFIVPAALAVKTIHPYSDFMLHDIGTGDGIIQNGGPDTRNMIRTAPLWGLRARTRLMHDGESLTPKDALLRHAGQAASVITAYGNLLAAERQEILDFLSSL